MTFELKPGDYITHEQMEREAEHWQRVGPELLRVLEKVWSNPGNKSWLASDYGKDIQEAITKARSIK